MSNYPIILETISPLHIGSGESITSVGEYVATNKIVRIIDQEHLRSLLETYHLKDPYLDFILNYAKNTHVWDFFTDQEIDKELQFVREFPLNAKAFNPQSNNILELAIETSNQKYIPGSSLKGAIRTLVFAYCIYSDSSLQREIEGIISSNDNLYSIIKGVHSFENEWLDSDFKNISVRDSLGVANENIVAEIAKRVHLFGVETDGLDNLRECIMPGTQIKTMIGVKSNPVKAQLQWLYEEDLTGLFPVINQMMDLYIIFEIGLLSKSNDAVAKKLINSLHAMQREIKQYGSNTALLRLGKGKTYLFQIILPILSPESQSKIIELIVKEKEARSNFPKTRVLNDYNEMFGWVKLSLPAMPVSETDMVDNEIEALKVGETNLIAYAVDLKTVQLRLNGVFLEKVQMVNKFKIAFGRGAQIQVVVKQITKDGRLNQVEPINK